MFYFLFADRSFFPRCICGVTLDIHPNNLNLSFNYFFLRLSSAKLQLKTFLLFFRDSFLFLLLLSPFFSPFLIALSSSAFGPLVSKCEQMENKSNGGLVWSGQRLAGWYFFTQDHNCRLMVWTLICCTFHIFCFSLAQTSVRGIQAKERRCENTLNFRLVW